MPLLRDLKRWFRIFLGTDKKTLNRNDTPDLLDIHRAEYYKVMNEHLAQKEESAAKE